MVSQKRAIPEVKRLRGRARMERNRRLMMANPLCVECERLGVVKAAEEWDHIIPLWKGGKDDETNLQGLCDDHHGEKTAREAAERHGGGGGSSLEIDPNGHRAAPHAGILNPVLKIRA